MFPMVTIEIDYESVICRLFSLIIRKNVGGCNGWIDTFVLIMSKRGGVFLTIIDIVLKWKKRVQLVLLIRFRRIKITTRKKVI